MPAWFNSWRGSFSLSCLSLKAHMWTCLQFHMWNCRSILADLRHVIFGEKIVEGFGKKLLRLLPCLRPDQEQASLVSRIEPA